MTVMLILGYIPLMAMLLVVSFVASSRRNDSEAARALGDQLGRRSGTDRRSTQSLAFVGAERRTGADRRAADEVTRAA